MESTVTLRFLTLGLDGSQGNSKGEAALGSRIRLGRKWFHFGPKDLGYPKMPPTLHGDIEEGVIRVRTVDKACRVVEKNSECKKII